MYRYLVATVFVVLCGGLLSATAQKIYEAEDIADAKLKVYAVDEAKDADLLVHFVYEKPHVTRIGLWMEVPTPQEADILIYFVDDIKESNITIWLVDTPDEAKWQNEAKKPLLPPSIIKPPK